MSIAVCLNWKIRRSVKVGDLVMYGLKLVILGVYVVKCGDREGN